MKNCHENVATSCSSDNSWALTNEETKNIPRFVFYFGNMRILLL